MNRKYEVINRDAWDERARGGGRHTRTVKPEHLSNPLPILDPEGWIEGGLRGRRVLCLAAGGGLQSALCAAAGAEVTVVDVSRGMLDRDESVAREHGLRVRVLELDMRRLVGVESGCYDVVIHPVSTCYVPEVEPVFCEVARVMRTGGVYISQHKQPGSQQASARPLAEGYVLVEPCVSARPLAPLIGEWRHRESEMTEFVHPLERLIGGLCRAGFVVEDLVEPFHGDTQAVAGSFEHRSAFVPPFVKIKARRRSEPSERGRIFV